MQSLLSIEHLRLHTENKPKILLLRAYYNVGNKHTYLCVINSLIQYNIMSKTKTGSSKPNPNYPSTTGKPSGGSRGNTPKTKK